MISSPATDVVQVQAAVVADLTAADESDALTPHILSFLLGDDRSCAARAAYKPRCHRFVWDLLERIGSELSVAIKSAEGDPSFAFGNRDLLRDLQLLEDLFIRGKQHLLKRTQDVSFGFLSDVSSLLVHLRKEKEAPRATGGSATERLHKLNTAILEWQAHHQGIFDDVVNPPTKKQIAERIEDLLGLEARRTPIERDEDDLSHLLGNERGLDELMRKAERDSRPALQLLVTSECVESFGLERCAF